MTANGDSRTVRQSPRGLLVVEELYVESDFGGLSISRFDQDGVAVIVLSLEFDFRIVSEQDRH
jgi:hypothetical protein